MISQYKVSLERLIKEFKLEILNMPCNADEVFIQSTDVTRPSLQLAGYTEVFADNRLQVMGKTEVYYLKQLPYEIAEKRCQRYFEMHPIATIISRDLDAASYIVNAAKINDAPLLRTDMDTCEFISALITFLQTELAPRITRHGVLMEVYGEGILLVGESGIGKSEVAVELISRGHRLVADDAVEIRKINSRTLQGASPDNIRHFMELRGVGIVSARALFGMGSVKERSQIDLVIKLETWDDTVEYDRFGNTNEYVRVMDVDVPVITIPVKPGRNIAVIIQTATMNFRLRKMGFNPTKELFKGLNIPEDEADLEEKKVITDIGWDTI